MKIIGIKDMTLEQLNDELARGGKFVTYQYCISVIVMSFKRSSDIYLIRADENAFLKGVPYTCLSFFLGWWGIPWGPIYTIGSIITNCMGGKNVTQDVLKIFNKSEE